MAAVRRSTWLGATIVAALFGFICASEAVWAASPAYGAAYFQWEDGPDSAGLVLLPMVGPEAKVALPAGLPADFSILASSPDGKAIYGHSPANGLAPQFDKWPGIIKIEFNPARQSIVPGSIGLSGISSLTLSQSDSRIFVSTLTRSLRGEVDCGDFEIDPNAGSSRPLQTGRTGRYAHCGGAISPDGKRRFLYTNKDVGLSIADLDTGEAHPVGAGLDRATWSPDGRWIAAVLTRSGNSSIVLIDVTDLSRRRNLGSGEGPLVWSPDSKYLLAPKSQLSCMFTLYGESLQIINVESGKRIQIKSSHCRIAGGRYFWMSPNVVR